MTLEEREYETSTQVKLVECPFCGADLANRDVPNHFPCDAASEQLRETLGPAGLDEPAQ